MQSDRRRINAPPGGTAPPTFTPIPQATLQRISRTRAPDQHRKIFLTTGVVPSASGSAYYEISPAPLSPSASTTSRLLPSASNLKITCSVHGPKPLPRNAAFNPNLLLTTHVKFASFANRRRRGPLRDAGERDLGQHLETALRGAVIAERWPKSCCEVVVTVLEGEEDTWWGEKGPEGTATGTGRTGGEWGLMTVLAGCITVASAALVDAGIDCVDLLTGGVAAVVRDGPDAHDARVVLDPCPAEHEVQAAAVVGYLQSRDEITAVWMKGDAGARTEVVLDQAVKAACMTRAVLAEAVRETAEAKVRALQEPETDPWKRPVGEAMDAEPTVTTG